MIMFVGEKPSKPDSPQGALAGNAGQRLSKILGISYERFLLYPRFNVNVDFWNWRLLEDENAKPDGFDMLEAKREAERILELAGTDDVLVLLGKRVARAFGYKLAGASIFHHVVLDGPRIIFMPHPSGRNRFWNHSDFEREAAILTFKHVPKLAHDRLHAPADTVARSMAREVEVREIYGREMRERVAAEESTKERTRK